MNDRIFIWIAQACYAISAGVTIYRLRRSNPAPTTNYATILAGFILSTLFLYERGQVVHRCPLTNPFETTIFITWAAVLFYLMIGPAYRVSFLGAFTAPVALTLGLIALFGLDDTARQLSSSHSPWVDFHASIAILACGAFTLASVTGLMYVIQEHQLKSRKFTPSFLLLPSIEQLEVINFRLTLMGFVMLTVGMIGGVISYRIIGHLTTPKLIWAIATYLAYTGLIAGRLLWSWRGKRSIQLSMLVFVFVLIAYWGTQ